MKNLDRADRAKSRPVYYHTGGFPPRNINWSRLVPLIGPASAALARYDGLLVAIPNAAVLLSPLTMQGMLRLLRKSVGARPSTYAFPELMNIAEGHKVFCRSPVIGN